MQEEISQLKEEIEYLKKKLNEFTDSATISEQFLSALVKRGFMRVNTILQYNNVSGLEFRTIFIEHNDKNTALTGFDRSYYVPFTAATSDTCTSNGHTLQDNDTVYLISTGTLPAPLDNTTLYHVINSATNTFKLSTSQGGAAVNITDIGSGTHYLQLQ
jgi:hypothetical protein